MSSYQLHLISYMRKILSFLFLTSFIFASCGRKNDVPAYLNIQPFHLNVSSSQGSASQKITDAWIYVGGVLNGVYELPATFPILETGSQTLHIFPGVRNNGIKSNPVQYPFYNSLNLTKTLTPAKLDTLFPQTAYSSDARFIFKEDFEGASNIFRNDLDGNSALTISNQPGGFEGKSGKITLDRANASFVKGSAGQIPLTAKYQYIYLELNYKTDAYLTVGAVSYDQLQGGSPSSAPIIQLKPNADWNKIYINLTNEAQPNGALSFSIFLQGDFTSDLPGSTATVLIDNAKLIVK